MRAMLSTTSSVWTKLSLWDWPCFSTVPFRAVSSGRMYSSSPALSSRESPVEGRGAARILFSSAVMRSKEMMDRRARLRTMASNDSGSMTNPN